MKYEFNNKEHVHLLDNRPLYGTSTVVGVLGGNFGYYAAGKAVECITGLADPKVFTRVKNKKATELDKTTLTEVMTGALDKTKTLTVEQFTELMAEAYRAHDTYKKERAETGEDWHSDVEAYIKDCIKTNGGAPKPLETENKEEKLPKQVEKFILWAVKNVKEFLWSEAHCYSETLWTGGIVDWGAILNNGLVVVGDLKSNKIVFEKHLYQVGGYDLQITENGLFQADGEALGVKVPPITAHCIFSLDGEAEPFIIENTTLGKEAFKNCLELHKAGQTFVQIKEKLNL